MNNNEQVEVKQQTRKRPRKRPNGAGRAHVSIFALGGLDEIGKNMYAIQCADEIVVVDAGIKFPGSDLPGVDQIVPNIQYLLENRDKVKAILLTHGHEDHIGGLPYVLGQLNVPVYGAALSIGLVKAKLEEHRQLNHVELHVIDDESVIRFNRMSARFFRTNHSIPDSLGVVLQTPQGNIVHTGDFKFDLTPVGHPADIQKMAAIGKEGVLALLSDSTNSEKPGYTPSEKTVGAAILDSFRQCEGRILFATFASNVHRLQQVVEAADACGRRMAVIGRSMEKVFRIGQELGYIRMPKGMLIDAKRLDSIPDEQVVVVCTGSQGEPNAALTRIANGSHPNVQVYPGDTVIFSSSPIPGNTQNVNRSIDSLFRAGANVIHGSIMDIHASGHGCQEDLKLMIRLMNPQYLIPIHGEHRMQVRHGMLAEELGLPKEHIFVLDNGQTLQVSKRMARRGKDIPAGEVYIKGKTASEQESEVIQERKKLSDSGVMIVLVSVDRATYTVLDGPDLISRGFVYVREAEDILGQATRIARRICARLSKKQVTSRKVWMTSLRQALASHFEASMDRSPMIEPIIMEVDRGQAQVTSG